MVLYNTDGESRELYDLCRLYKFKFKEFIQKKETNDKYGNKWTGDLVADARKELDDIKYQMLEELIDDLLCNNVHSVKIERRWGNHLVTVSDKKFADIVGNVVKKKYCK